MSGRPRMEQRFLEEVHESVRFNNKTRRWDFICPYVDCFRSTDWPSQHLAIQRGMEHQEEHFTKKPMRELAEFRKAMGL